MATGNPAFRTTTKLIIVGYYVPIETIFPMNLYFNQQLSSEKLMFEQPGPGPLLAIETCAKSASVAIEWPDGRLVSDKTDPSIGSARTLAPAIARILEANSVKATELAAIAVTVGPGSFTGLRVGVATAKSMAYALSIPTIAVDSLETMALETEYVAALEKSPDGHSESRLVWTVLDAYRGQLFAALWQVHPRETRNRCNAIIPPQLVDVDSWTDAILSGDLMFGLASPHASEKMPIESVVLVGPGLIRCKRLVEAAHTLGMAMHIAIVPLASMVARIGRQKLIQNRTTDAFDLMPVYLRGSAAEEKLAGSNREPIG